MDDLVKVEPTMEDRDRAARAAFALGVPDISGPRAQEILARQLARHRLAEREMCAKVAEECPIEVNKAPGLADGASMASRQIVAAIRAINKWGE